MKPRLVGTILMLMIALILALPAPARQEQKPFTQDQVQGLVRDGLEDESGANLIEQRGIDFAPAERRHSRESVIPSGSRSDQIGARDLALSFDWTRLPERDSSSLALLRMTDLRASEAFLKALRAAKPPEPASAKKPLNQVQVFALLVGQVASHRVTMLVQERGIDFEPTDEYLQEVHLAGGEDELITALKGAKVTKSAKAPARKPGKPAKPTRPAAKAKAKASAKAKKKGK